MSQLTHHAMVFVPVESTFGAGMFDMDEVRCCRPYGSGTFAGADGRSRLPSDAELQMAVHQGNYFAAFAKQLKAGAAERAWSPEPAGVVLSLFSVLCHAHPPVQLE